MRAYALAAAIQAADGSPAGGIGQWFAALEGGPILRATLLVLIGLPAAYWGAKWARRFIADRHGAQWGLVAGKVVVYPALLLLMISVLRELGFSLAPLLGAAGILGIALGFASQTSVSNVISGLFLLGEQPFAVDDVIQIGDTTGRVMSVDMLSVKLRTFDNRFVRIPNETIIKSQVTTATRFPLRRVDLSVGIAYKEDVGRVQELLLGVADRNPLCMMEPEPKIFVDGFGESSVNLRLTVWTTTENFWDVKNRMFEEVKAELDREGVEIAFPHRTLYTGLATGPLPVEIVARADGAAATARA